MIGKTVCQTHGGKTPTGLALPQTTHGRYSKNLPTRMLASYDAARQDKDLLAMRDDLALMDARIEDLLARVDTGESGENWDALAAAMKGYRKAANDIERAEAIDAVETIIWAGQSDYAAWREVRSVAEQRRKTSESEQKRLVAMQQMMSGEQATLLMGQILQIIKKNVTDRTVLAAVARDIGLLAVARSGE